MFRIECFCDDAKLPKVLWLLQGNVYNMTSMPVVNANKKGNRVQAKSGDILEMFANFLKEGKYKEITPAIAKEFGESIGRAKNYYSSLLKKAIDAGMLSRIGAQFRYRVLLGQSIAKKKYGGKRKEAGRKRKMQVSRKSKANGVANRETV